MVLELFFVKKKYPVFFIDHVQIFTDTIRIFLSSSSLKKPLYRLDVTSIRSDIAFDQE